MASLWTNASCETLDPDLAGLARIITSDSNTHCKVPRHGPWVVLGSGAGGSSLHNRTSSGTSSHIENNPQDNHGSTMRWELMAAIFSLLLDLGSLFG